MLGKVPLGTAKKGRRNRFRWNGKVNGKRLGRGTYLLTYRSLKGTRITNTSASVLFKVAKGGKLRQVRAEPRPHAEALDGAYPPAPWRGTSTWWARSTSTSSSRPPRCRAPARPWRAATFERHGGGKSANQAVAAARLGANVRMVGAVGADDLGQEALRRLEAEGIDVSGRAARGQRDRGRADRRRRGRREPDRGRLGANAELGGDAVEATLRGADGGVVLLGFEVPDPPVLAGARAARAAGLEVVVNPAPARELPGALLELSPLLTPNLDERARSPARTTRRPPPARWRRGRARRSW